MTSPLLSLQNVKRHFSLASGETLRILNGINLDVHPGEVAAVVGKSGSGKSTLLNLLGLLDSPSSGTYLCGDVNVGPLSDAKLADLRASYFGFVFQQYLLLDRRTALENVAEPLLFGNAKDIANRNQRSMELLDAVGLADRANQTPSHLSGGEQQRVAIARAMVRNPRMILADEPTGALDVTTGEMVLDMLFNQVREREIGMILVTHDTAVASQADAIYTLENGQLHKEEPS